MKRKNDSSKRMKSYIAQALLLLMEDADFKDITIGAITNKAGVHRSTYYRHYTSKEDVVKYYIVEIMEQHSSKVDKENTPFRVYLLNMFNVYFQHKKELMLIYNSGLSYLLLEVFNDAFSNVDKDVSSTDLYAVYYHTGGIYNNFLLWFSNGMKESPKEMANIATSFLPSDFEPMLEP